MNKNYEIINYLKKITKEKSQLKTLYYFLLMYGYRPYYNKYNCGFIWVNGELVSEIFTSSYNASLTNDSVKEIEPLTYLHLSVLHKKIKSNSFNYELPMMSHFVFHYHFRTLFEEPTDEENINFLCSQISKHKRTHIKNSYAVLQELNLLDKGNCEKFNPKQIEWEKILKKEKV